MSDLVRAETLAKLGLLTEEQLANVLENKVETLRKWREKGLGPNWVKLGQKVFYRQADVDVWVNRSVVDPFAPAPGTVQVIG